MRRILFCGSRDWDDADLIRSVMENMLQGGRFIVVHGGARGADRMAGSIARSLGLEVEEYPARWSSFGRSAGYIRNVQMADTHPDLVVAFHIADSTGTAMMLDIARQRGIETLRYFPQGLQEAP